MRRTMRVKARALLEAAGKADNSQDRVNFAYTAETLAIELGDQAMATKAGEFLKFHEDPGE